MNTAEELTANLEFMQRKLEAARVELEAEPLWFEVVKADGNTVKRKNPAFDAYSQMLRSFTRCLDALKAQPGEAEAPKLVEFERFARTMKRTADA